MQPRLQELQSYACVLRKPSTRVKTGRSESLLQSGLLLWAEQDCHTHSVRLQHCHVQPYLSPAEDKAKIGFLGWGKVWLLFLTFPSHPLQTQKYLWMCSLPWAERPKTLCVEGCLLCKNAFTLPSPLRVGLDIPVFRRKTLWEVTELAGCKAEQARGAEWVQCNLLSCAPEFQIQY